MTYDMAVARAAYNAYRQTESLSELPEFEKLPEYVRTAWTVATHQAVQTWIDRHRDATIAALDWVHLTETSVLVIRLDPSDGIDVDADCTSDNDFIDAIRRIVPPGCKIFYAHGHTALESFSAEEMAKHGWVRKPAEGTRS